MTALSNKRVVCAAIRHRESGEIVLGVRHGDSFMRIAIKNTHSPDDCDYTWYNKDVEQGFVTNEFNFESNQYNFVTREEALSIALLADQRIRRCGGDEHKLYSENLY